MVKSNIEDVIAHSSMWFDLKLMKHLEINEYQLTLNGKILNGIPRCQVQELYRETSKAAGAAKSMEHGTYMLYILSKNHPGDETDYGFGDKVFHIMKV